MSQKRCKIETLLRTILSNRAISIDLIQDFSVHATSADVARRAIPLRQLNFLFQRLTVKFDLQTSSYSTKVNKRAKCQHCVPQNDIALACYNFDEHRTILIIFGRNVAKKSKQ